MCRIVGIYKYSKKLVEKEKLLKMNDLLRHRGPDFGDVLIDGNVGIGHRWLSSCSLINPSVKLGASHMNL